jgi:hypothetical protein
MKDEKKAVLICFSVKSGKFESHYERNKFFRGLYGWKQMITKDVFEGRARTHKKTYTYRREGLLDEIPHQKVDQSSFIVTEDDFTKIMHFLKEWHDKVMWKSFKVLLEDDMKDFFEEEEEEI